MPIKTRRWNAPAEPDDGERILVTRYRPRGLPKAKETWNVWMRDLGPSPALFDRFKGKAGPSITLSEYRERYIEEMQAQQAVIDGLAERANRGETITLLCSRDCWLEQACHRTILAELIENARKRLGNTSPAAEG